MKRFLSLATILMFATIMFNGCGSQVPISDARDSAIDPALLGAWEAVDPEEGDTIRALILQFNENEYYGEVTDHERSDDGKIVPKTQRLRLFVSKLQQKDFLNVQSIDSSESREYLLARFEVGDGGKELTLWPLIDFEDPGVDDFNTSSQLREYIVLNIDNSELYDKPHIFQRIK